MPFLKKLNWVLPFRKTNEANNIMVSPKTAWWSRRQRKLYTTCSNVFSWKKIFWGDKNRIPSLLSEPKSCRQNYGNDTPLGKNSSNDLKIGENEAVLLIAACRLGVYIASVCFGVIGKLQVLTLEPVKKASFSVRLCHLSCLEKNHFGWYAKWSV